MKYHVYILLFDTNHYYIGSSNDIKRRLKQHRFGHTPSTKRLGSAFRLVFSQEFPTLVEARQIEAKLKSWKRRDFIEKIISDGTIRYRPSKHP